MKNIDEFLCNFSYTEENTLFAGNSKTIVDKIKIDDFEVKRYTNEFWTSKQRQANSLHEISYRACFKPQLPRFFIENFTQKNDIIYDPFTGRGTTIIEGALLERNIIANDINPLSEILCKARLFIPQIEDLKKRLDEIKIDYKLISDIDLSMFYHNDTLCEILSLKNYLIEKKINNTYDYLDLWLQMVATNRLTGHSKGFFSVYTLPPNMAVSCKRQIKINTKKNQIPDYRDVKKIILKKTIDLLKNINKKEIENLAKIGNKALFVNCDARKTKKIKNDSVKLIVTSPPFLDVVQYADDNWLRCWFNNIDIKLVSEKITMSKNIDDWKIVMNDVLKELYRILRKDGLVAFEVGEVKNGKIKLDEHIAKIAINNNFKCVGIMINEQVFTKTANIWGVSNNSKGTNSNRIVILTK